MKQDVAIAHAAAADAVGPLRRVRGRRELQHQARDGGLGTPLFTLLAANSVYAWTCRRAIAADIAHIFFCDVAAAVDRALADLTRGTVSARLLTRSIRKPLPPRLHPRRSRATDR
jgi:hypothetical protein